MAAATDVAGDRWMIVAPLKPKATEPINVDIAWSQWCELASVPLAERDASHAARLRRAFDQFTASMAEFLAA